MSQENVEIVRRAYQSFRAVDVDALVDEYLDPQVAWHDPPEMPDADTYRGHEEVRQHLRGLLETAADVEVSAEEVLDCGDDRVLAFLLYRVTGAGSGIEMDVRPAHLWRIRDGRGLCVKIFLDRAEALEAAGLAE